MPTSSSSAVATVSDPGSVNSAVQGKSGAKKGRGLSALFADVLSQVQRGLGPKTQVSAQGGASKGAVSGGAIPGAAGHGGVSVVQDGNARTKASELLKSDKAKRANPAPSIVAPDSAGKSPAHGAQAAPRLDESRPGEFGQAALAKERLARSSPNRALPVKSQGPDEAPTSAGRASKSAEEKRQPKDVSIPSPELSGAVADRAKQAPLSDKAQQDGGAAGIDGEGAKKAKERSGAPKLSVLDLRRAASAKDPGNESTKEAEHAKSAPVDAKRVSQPGNELVRDLSFDQRSPASSLASPKAEAGRAGDFQSALAERLRDAWNGDIVQSAHIVLKDGDSGTIRLRLKPESLGNVKIELNLSDNNISGRITVESDEAKSAFEKNMGELADAFKQGGFDSARLEVAVGGGSGGNAGGDPGGDPKPFYSERFRSAVGSQAAPATASSAYARRGGSVDILA